MPVQSMTGYADAQEIVENSNLVQRPKIAMEIRSVNSRFLDLSFRLPDDVRGCEPRLRELLGKQLHRGKVEVRVYQENAAEALIAAPSSQWMQRLDSVQNTILSWLPQSTPLSVAEVIKLTTVGAQFDATKGGKLLLLAEIALGKLIASRQNEGDRLCVALSDRLTQLRSLVAKVQQLVPDLIMTQKNRFLNKWNAAMTLVETVVPTDAVQERALNEATSFAMRIDVSEELTRLESHFQEIECLIKNGEKIGKPLDFLIQELHREANTLGSKSGSLELTKYSMEMKILIEQMREQVQNLE
jgi:uncharacterized protein (TIGR00255 family)